MKKVLVVSVLILWTSCNIDKSKKVTISFDSLVVATTKNRSLLRSFILNPESVLTFKNNLPKNFAFTCHPISKRNKVYPGKYICYKFSFNRFNQNQYDGDEKPYGSSILEIFTIRDAKSESANDYFDKTEKLLGFTVRDTISGIKYSNLIGKDSVYIKTMFGNYDFRSDKYVGYEASESKLILYIKEAIVNEIEFKSNK